MAKTKALIFCAGSAALFSHMQKQEFPWRGSYDTNVSKDDGKYNYVKIAPHTTCYTNLPY